MSNVSNKILSSVRSISIILFSLSICFICVLSYKTNVRAAYGETEVYEGTSEYDALVDPKKETKKGATYTHYDITYSDLTDSPIVVNRAYSSSGVDCAIIDGRVFYDMDVVSRYNNKNINDGAAKLYIDGVEFSHYLSRDGSTEESAYLSAGEHEAYLLIDKHFGKDKKTKKIKFTISKDDLEWGYRALQLNFDIDGNKIKATKMLNDIELK